MSKFEELINNLKKDIQSLPSVDTPVREYVPAEDVVSTSAPVIVATETSTTNKSNRYLSVFMRHGFLSAEFFLFFLLFLSATKPSFLYYNERIVRNGRELWKTHFSFLYLISYSFLFTGILHLFIIIHRDVSKRY